MYENKLNANIKLNLPVISNAQKKEEYFKKTIEPNCKLQPQFFILNFPRYFVSPTGSLFKSQSFQDCASKIWISILATQLLLFFQILSRFGAWEILKWFSYYSKFILILSLSEICAHVVIKDFLWKISSDSFILTVSLYFNWKSGVNQHFPSKRNKL